MKHRLSPLLAVFLTAVALFAGGTVTNNDATSYAATDVDDDWEWD